jgi:hypothetical protein
MNDGNECTTNKAADRKPRGLNSILLGWFPNVIYNFLLASCFADRFAALCCPDPLGKRSV